MILTMMIGSSCSSASARKFDLQALYQQLNKQVVHTEWHQYVKSVALSASFLATLLPSPMAGNG
jgi:hypothetical protein